MRIEFEPRIEGGIGISGAAFRLPRNRVTVRELRSDYEASLQPGRASDLLIPKLRRVSLDEVNHVHVFNGEPEGSLALDAVSEILETHGVAGKEIGLLIDYSTASRAANGISLCYKLQRDLGADKALTLAVNNGSCASFQLALQTAVAFLKSRDEIQYAILFSEDRTRGKRFHPPMSVLGDGASALLLERNAQGGLILEQASNSMGKFCDILGVNHWNETNFDLSEFENRVVPLHYKITRELVLRVLERQQLTLKDIDLVLYQNMSGNDFRGLAAALGVDIDRIYLDGLDGHGHIFGSDLVINFCLARRAGKLSPGSRSLLISSGAGFSWAVTLIQN